MALTLRDVIIACAVAFVGWAWVTHWLPTLRFIPYAFIAGVLTFLAGCLYILVSTSRSERHAKPPPLPRSSYLSFTSPESWHSETHALEERLRYEPLKIKQDSPQISKRVDELLNLALRDFVTTWYSKISSGSAFSNEVDRSLRTSIETILERIAEVDLVDFGVTRLLPILNSHVRDFNEAERLVRGRKLNLDVTESVELDVAIAGRYRDGKLHPAASLAASKTTALQQQHLRRVAGRLVSEVLPPTMTSSSSVIVLIREILACGVLLPVMVLLSDPDVLNQLIDAYGRSIWQERKTVRKLREALDEAAAPSQRATKAVSLPALNPQDSDRKFEKFIRAIRHCSSLSDARRFRSEISRQIKRESTKNGRDSAYLRRLEIGRKLLDEKVTELSHSQVNDKQRLSQDTERSGGDSWREKATLRQVLYDASGLSYFMEFMDRRDRMSLVQFWIVVDGLRNPLDLDKDESENQAGNSSSSAWNLSDRQDLAQINSAYLSKPELNAPPSSHKAVQAFLDAGSHATNQQYKLARQAMLDIQASVFEELKDRHFAGFRKSDLYYKWLASEAPQKSAHNDTLSLPPHLLENDALSLPVHHVRKSELRRAIASSSDLPGSVKDSHEPRRSFDDSEVRNPLLGDEEDEDPLSRSTQSLGPPESKGIHEQRNQESMINAVQAALDDLIDGNAEEDPFNPTWNTPDALESSTASLDDSHHPGAIPASERAKPSLDSLGLLGTPSKPTVFSQGDLFGENEKLEAEENDEEEANGGMNDEDIQEAAPGDLGLSEVVQSMTLDIEKLEAQQAIVNSLTRKAELTNNAAELRILRKSKAGLEREIHHKTLQRQQYIIQKVENDLYGKATVAIKSIMVGNDPDGHEFALYVIEVQRYSEENAETVSWAIARRYSEFHELHRKLRSKFPDLKELDFPRRQVVVTLQRDFLKKRRAALEKYLQELLSRAEICRSREFRAFLSQQAIRPISNPDGNQVDRQDFITRIYNSVTDGMEEFLGNIPVLDQLSAAGQNLITAATSVPTTHFGGHNPGNPVEAAEAEAEITAFEHGVATVRDERVTFVKPICDIFLELFQLNQGNNWLRGRAVVVVIQQLLGGTIERRVRDTFKSLTSQDSVARYLDLLRDTMWPGGKLRTAPPPRSEAEKSQSRREAGLVLATLLPDLAGGVVGRSNAQKAARRIFATLNNERLNEHLLYTILDEVVDGVFGVRVGK